MFSNILKHSLMITLFVFVMMLIIDYINVLSQGKMGSWIKGGMWRQYTLSSFLGATPGCLGAFMNVSLYIRGMLSFGAIVGGMIATSGDEAFVMLILFPKKALLLFSLLFFAGIFFAWLTDRIAPVLKISPCEECRSGTVHYDEECKCFESPLSRNITQMSIYRFLLLFGLILAVITVFLGVLGPKEWGWQRITLLVLLLISTAITITVPEHYLKKHLWKHIAKKHIWRVFLWTLGALLIIEIGLSQWNLQGFLKEHMVLVLLMSGLVGLIPESGPHLVFVMLFSQGLIPFSVLFTSSFVQDGHGILPLLSYTARDSILIKLFNLVFGLGLGILLYSLRL